MMTSRWEKMGILARSLPGNLTIWRETLTFEIKKYIRSSGKSDYLAGKNTYFQAVDDISNDIIVNQSMDSIASGETTRTSMTLLSTLIEC